MKETCGHWSRHGVDNELTALPYTAAVAHSHWSMSLSGYNWRLKDKVSIRNGPFSTEYVGWGRGGGRRHRQTSESMLRVLFLPPADPGQIVFKVVPVNCCFSREQETWKFFTCTLWEFVHTSAGGTPAQTVAVSKPSSWQEATAGQESNKASAAFQKPHSSYGNLSRQAGSRKMQFLSGEAHMVVVVKDHCIYRPRSISRRQWRKDGNGDEGEGRGGQWFGGGGPLTPGCRNAQLLPNRQPDGATKCRHTLRLSAKKKEKSNINITEK